MTKPDTRNIRATEDAMRGALRVLQGCLEHPDADSAIASLQAALAPQPQPVTLSYDGPMGYAVMRNGKQVGLERSYESASRSWVDSEIVPLYAAQTVTQAPQGWVQECDDADELLRLLGLEPDHCRTDGGSINLPKVKALLSEKTPQPVTQALTDALTDEVLEAAFAKHKIENIFGNRLIFGIGFRSAEVAYGITPAGGA